MKNAFGFLQIFLLICGVIGVDADEVKSVIEGDSVTLNPDPAKIEGFNQIKWMFENNASAIAEIDGEEMSVLKDGIFRDRLQLDQTGSLTIKNMKIKHSGLYNLQVDLSSGLISIRFRVTVSESPPVIGAGKADMETVSVTMGDPVILHVPQIHGDELIVWRFGDEGKLIAKLDIEFKSQTLSDTEERFRDRLKLDQTGSLTITNTRTENSGEYTVKISSSKQTLYKRFIVTLSVPDPGWSSGAVAGIVVGVVGVLVGVAVGAGVWYYYSPKLQNRTFKTVMKGQSVILNPVTAIKKDDQILWMFKDENKETLIAEIKQGTGKIIPYDGVLDERFRGRLELDTITGTLTITNTRTNHSGLYKLMIRRGIKTLYEEFSVFVSERLISVFEGESVTLNPDTEINKDDLILWSFGDEMNQTNIAEIKAVTEEMFTYDYTADGRFRDRLKLDKNAGSLTIMNTRTDHTGLYKLHISSSSSGGVSYETFNVAVREKVEEIFLQGEDDVTLNPNTQIQKDDLVLWKFEAEEVLIAQIRGQTREIFTYDEVPDGRFRDRLKLDNQTGSLTITNTRIEHTGLYKLQIISSRGISYKKFKVLKRLRYESTTEGKSVTLHARDEIKTADVIQWMFGDENSLIAEFKIQTGEFTKYDEAADGRFRDRLQLDKLRSLTITNTTTEHAGRYEQKICSSKGNTNKAFIVIIRKRGDSPMEGNNAGNRVNEVKMSLLNRENVDV